MLKFGITKKGQLKRRENFLGRKRKISIPLLMELIEREGDDKYGDIFNDIYIKGTYKKTCKGRFKKLDKIIARLVKERLGPTRCVSVHDVGASNGITSVELFRRLEEEGISVDFVASDFFPHIYVVKMQGNPWKVVLDSELSDLQYVGLGFVLSEPESKFDPINRAILKWLKESVLPKAKKLVELTIRDRNEYRRSTYENWGGKVERYPLLSKACLMLLKEGKNFRYIRHNIFHRTKATFDVIRAMNILNRSYFSDSQIAVAVKNVAYSLNDGGLFIVGRSDDVGSKSEATVFIKDKNKFLPLLDIAGGSEISELVSRVTLSQK